MTCVPKRWRGRRSYLFNSRELQSWSSHHLLTISRRHRPAPQRQAVGSPPWQQRASRGDPRGWARSLRQVQQAPGGASTHSRQRVREKTPGFARTHWRPWKKNPPGCGSCHCRPRTKKGRGGASRDSSRLRSSTPWMSHPATCRAAACVRCHPSRFTPSPVVTRNPVPSRTTTQLQREPAGSRAGFLILRYGTVQYGTIYRICAVVLSTGEGWDRNIVFV